MECTIPLCMIVRIIIQLLGPEDMSLFQRVLQASMELGPDDVSLLERCPHFRGCYIQASRVGPEDVSL